MKKKIGFLLLCVFCMSGMLRAQVTARGVLVDADTREPLIGATVFEPVSKAATITDLDGSFSLKLPDFGNRELEFSYIGYLPEKAGAQADIGTIALRPDEVVLGDVVVTSSVAIRRKTPVALSVIEPEQIEYKLGTQEFPEILKSTPSVYATKQGGGFGDSRVNVRGFESANVAVMINGVPMNDMEWGGIYWSNWAGLSDVTRSMQVQRGLGASKVSAPTVGGSINILTKSTDAEKGGFASYDMGNDGYNKIAFSVSSGLTSNGWAITLLGAKRWGNGYILGTEYEGYSYFLNISKIINDSHQLSFTGFGAPQTHYQRYSGDKLFVQDWQKQRDGYKFNPSYGVDADGKRKAGSYNHFHKPQLSLNHYWTMNSQSSLSTALYLSLGFGGGYGWRGKATNDLYGTNTSTGQLNTTYRGLDGYMDFGKLQAENAANPNGSQAVIADSRNNHTWVGLLSTYNNKLTPNLDLSGGIDVRYYAGLHDAYIVDLMGGKYFIDTYRGNVLEGNSVNAGNTAWINEKLKEGDTVYRDNTGYNFQGGVFGQLEYTLNDLNAFISGSISHHSYWKVDRFYYDNAKSEVGNFLGFTVKGGANYNLTKNHNVFGNIGYISRAPFMSGGYFTSIHSSNVTNPNAVNEKLFSAEIGYGYRSKNFTANLNLYHTNWMDKTLIRSTGTNPDDGFINIEGMDALHQGIELEVIYKPVNNLELTGMFSIGNWRWQGEATGYSYNRYGQALDSKNNPVEPLSPEHAKSTLIIDGVKVGNSAQTTAAFGVRYKFLKDFSVGADLNYMSNNYSDFSWSTNYGETTYHTPWKIPEAALVDINAQYRFSLGGMDATLKGNIENLLNQTYISDAKDLNNTGDNYSDWTNVAVMYGFGRTYSVGLKIRF